MLLEFALEHAVVKLALPFVSADVGARSEYARVRCVVALVAVERKRVAPRLDAGTAENQCMGPSRTAMVFQRGEARTSRDGIRRRSGRCRRNEIRGSADRQGHDIPSRAGVCIDI